MKNRPFVCEKCGGWLHVAFRALVGLCGRTDGRSVGLRGGAGVLGSVEGTREARQDAVRARLAGLQSQTLERTDSAHVDRRHTAARLLRVQRRQHAQPLLRVRRPTY